MPNVIALIPARGGSKGIKHKNIVLLAEKPLMAHSIVAAKNSRYISSIFVSSDDADILSVAKNEMVNTINRNPVLAQDISPTDPVIAELIEKAQLKAEDIIILLQPTSPLRQAHHIDEAFALFEQTPECRALISVCEADSKYLYAFSGADPYLTPLLPEYMKVARRQDLPKIYLPNGAIYIFSVANFTREQKIPKEKIIAYIMDTESSVDIDTLADLQRVERIIATRKTSY